MLSEKDWSFSDVWWRSGGMLRARRGPTHFETQKKKNCDLHSRIPYLHLWKADRPVYIVYHAWFKLLRTLSTKPTLICLYAQDLDCTASPNRGRAGRGGSKLKSVMHSLDSWSSRFADGLVFNLPAKSLNFQKRNPNITKLHPQKKKKKKKTTIWELPSPLFTDFFFLFLFLWLRKYLERMH